MEKPLLRFITLFEFVYVCMLSTVFDLIGNDFQVCLRWIIEQGATVVVKSHRKERMIENLGVFDWELNDDDHEMINQIPQYQLFRDLFVSPIGPYKTSQELWDEDI